MHSQHAVTIVLLAGGRATRLPGKLTRPIGDQPMVVKVFKQLAASGRSILISIREPLPPAIAALMPAPTVTDVHGDVGPLGGLASAAARVSTPLLFAVAGDLPNINSSVIEALERRYGEEIASGKAAPEVVLPRHPSGEVEPLAALYDTSALRTGAERMLARGRMKVTQALEGLRVSYYDIPPHDEKMFLNVNTLDDFAGIAPQ